MHSSWMCSTHSSLLTARGVDLVVVHVGFPLKQKSSIFFIVATLIAEVLFEQFLISNAMQQVEQS